MCSHLFTLRATSASSGAERKERRASSGKKCWRSWTRRRSNTCGTRQTRSNSSPPQKNCWQFVLRKVVSPPHGWNRLFRRPDRMGTISPPFSDSLSSSGKCTAFCTVASPTSPPPAKFASIPLTSFGRYVKYILKTGREYQQEDIYVRCIKFNIARRKRVRLRRTRSSTRFPVLDQRCRSSPSRKSPPQIQRRKSCTVSSRPSSFLQSPNCTKTISNCSITRMLSCFKIFLEFAGIKLPINFKFVENW